MKKKAARPKPIDRWGNTFATVPIVDDPTWKPGRNPAIPEDDAEPVDFDLDTFKTPSD